MEPLFKGEELEKKLEITPTHWEAAHSYPQVFKDTQQVKSGA